jgi:predicted RNA-binding Zn ribbon-like protein
LAADIGLTSLAEIVSGHDRESSGSLSSSFMSVRPVVSRKVHSINGKWERTAAEAMRAFLDEQHRFQARKAAVMRADPKLAEQASPETIERNQLLIATLDGN